MKLTNFQKKTYIELIKAEPSLFDCQVTFNELDDELILTVRDESNKVLRNIVIFDEGLIAISEIGMNNSKLTFINK